MQNTVEKDMWMVESNVSKMLNSHSTKKMKRIACCSSGPTKTIKLIKEEKIEKQTVKDLYGI